MGVTALHEKGLTRIVLMAVLSVIMVVAFVPLSPMKANADPAQPTITASASSSEVKAAGTFAVNVNLADNTGVAAYTLSATYDHDAMELVGVERGSFSGEGVFVPNTGAGDAITSTVTWYNTADVTTASGTLFTLTFNVKANATPGRYTVAIEKGTNGCFSGISGSDQDVTFVNAAVDIKPIGTKGDINNNSKVNIVDSQIVFNIANNEYGSDWAVICERFGTGVAKADIFWIADVNEDSDVDALDAHAIQYYSHYGTFDEVETAG